MTTTSPDLRQARKQLTDRERRIHPVKLAALEAAKKIADFEPTRVVGEPESDDVSNLINDGEVLAAIFDPVLKAWGEYAASHLGMNRKDRACFDDIVFGALHGNNLFLIQRAWDERQEDAADAED